jgi:hypothetical protein
LAPLAFAQTLEHRITTVPESEFGERLKQYAASNPDKTQKGVIDVTCHPYNAKGDGVADDTQAIQDAIDDAYPNSFMVYLPADKTFLVSKQLKLLAPLETRRYGHQLIGSAKGKKPVIRLKDGSEIEDNILVWFFYTGEKSHKDACHYGATFRNIHIDMGTNPAVSALSMSGAQHCVIEDVKIYGQSFRSGIKNLPGSGGGSVNVHVVGGDIGIHQEKHRPNPTIHGLVLEGQREYGIKLDDTRGPLVVAGFRITGPQDPSPEYRAITLNNTDAQTPSSGKVANHSHGYADMCLTDGSIEVPGEGGVAISNGSQDISLVDVYIKAGKLIENGVTTPPYSFVDGSSNAWKRLSSYAFTSKIDKSSAVIEGKSLNDREEHYEMLGEITEEAPGSDIYGRHSYGEIPDFNDPDIVDITDYGATPANKNAKDDDAVAIQKALDDVSNPKSANFGKTVLIPRGNFHLQQPILVKMGTRLIGTAKNISTLVVDKAWKNSKGAIVSTVDDAHGNILLSDFTIMGYPRMCYLRIQSANTVIRDIVTEDKFRYGWPINDDWKKNRREGVSYIEFSKDAGGKVYHLSLDHIMLEDRNRSGAPVSGYHLVGVENTTHPLAFYQLSVEHHTHSPKVMVNNAKHLTIFGLKYEAPAELLNIINSEDIHISGGSGNYYIDRETDRAMVVISNSGNVVLRNLVRTSKNGMFGRTYQDSCKFWIIDSGTTVDGYYSVLWYQNGVLDSRIGDD